MKKCFLFLLFTLAVYAGYSQSEFSLENKSLLDIKAMLENPAVEDLLNFQPLPLLLFPQEVQVAPPLNSTTFELPTDYVEQLPFFCTIEYKMEQKTKIPVRFRLGSVEYVDRLEQKLRH